MPGEPWSLEPAEPDIDHAISDTPYPWEIGDPPVLAADRAVHRWLLGHHVAFGLWRLLGDALRVMSQGEISTADEEIVAWLFDCYSETLVYSASCSAEVYADRIRPAMAAVHPAFSGRWGRDYEAVRSLLEEIDLPAGGSLARAVARNRRVHLLVARKLVPDGDSLFKDAGHRRDNITSDVERDLFDRFFRVQRQATSRSWFLIQLDRRISAIRYDIARYPLGTADDFAVPTPYLLSVSSGTRAMRDIASFCSTRAGQEQGSCRDRTGE
ncbi:hypothetical protein [Amycolatopsis sp. H20-H5]|uniref:hypothetical protein n=1 Tax=Amycolatopsis sp. H20-H5 TaxID=3046309 RepID=UPI002DBB6D58|nr:hypothetical protein [Amycolatopsis sp. H20-H5]MEC3975553.1 hypothetical protein [Amycolatopsis sp. H20-H5]